MTAKKTSKGIIKDLIIVVIGVFAIWGALWGLTGTQNPFYVVSSGSMVPELNVFDVLIINGHIPFEELQVGDTIVFNRPAGHDRVIVHRIVSVIDQDPYTLRTKGDANPASIPGTDFPITEEEYLGKVSYVIPQVGYVTRILQPPVNYIIIVIIIGIMIFKQIAKKKSEKELAFSDPLDSNPSEETNRTFDFSEFKEIPKDPSYTKKEGKPQDLERNETKDDFKKLEEEFDKRKETLD